MAERITETPAGVTGLNRRDFLALAAAATAAGSLAGRSGVQAASTAPRRTDSLSLDLGGDTWTLQQKGKPEVIAAHVPGCQYEDLLKAGKIPDPYYREQNGDVQWVANETWIYQRTFKVGEDLLKKEHVQLICHGLDTLATVWINDRHLADTDNMFRTWVLDAKPLLRAGNNSIRIEFHPLADYVKQHAAAYNKKYNINLGDQRSWVRKGPYMWDWDWCRAILTAGIWKNMEIVGFDSRITDVAVFQTHQPAGPVHLKVETIVVGEQKSGGTAHATVLFNGQKVAGGSAAFVGDISSIPLVIDHPKLWWPNGMGEQPLYVVEVELRNVRGEVVDTMSRRTGLRKVEVLPPKNGVAMHVEVNGVAFFAKGADWIPADNIPTRVTSDILRWYMQTAKDCNFNFIRLWGGGYYEEDALFDACDELGIMLQFEFKFANDTYPVRDANFIANLRAELQDNIRRVRNHPSIAIWSGNNEINYFKGYNYLFGGVIGGEVHKLVPGAFYEVGSGASGSGDVHDWTVWHGMQPFSSYRNVQGFVTEFGMQSFPDPKTVRMYTDKADRTSITSPVMGYHEMSYGPGGINRITHYMTEYFGPLPTGFDNNLWLSQVMQAYGIGSGVEFWRRDMPHSMAATIWQYNDCWPAPTWAMVDWYRRFKAIQYHSRHFFAPVLVSGVMQKNILDIHVISDRMEDCAGVLSWQLTDTAGKELLTGKKNVNVAARTAHLAESVDLSEVLGKHRRGAVLGWLKVRVGSRVVSENVVFLTHPLAIELRAPVVATHIVPADHGFAVTLTAQHPALYTFLDLHDIDATYSDNFVHIAPGNPVTIQVRPTQAISPAEFASRLKARSLIDLMNTSQLGLTGQPGPVWAGADGRFLLLPFAAILHGDALLAEFNHGGADIGYWNNTKDWIQWDIHVTKPGRYQVMGGFATPMGSAQLQLSLAGQRIIKTVAKTPSWHQPDQVSFGTIDLPHAGNYTVNLHAADAASWHPVNVLHVSLVPK